MREIFLKDDQYPFTQTTHLRKIARAIVLDEQGNVALHHIHRNDIFGDQWYYETPGGGVDEGETFEEAVVRECEEELGYEVEVLAPLSIVHDFYNLIGRENENRFFLAKRKREVGVHFASDGDTMIQETIYVPFDEAIRLMSSQEDKGVSLIVKRRELPILLEAKELWESR